jgi:hypothetical protein
MDHNLLTLLIHNHHYIDHSAQFEDDERGRFSHSRRSIERHDLELQALINETSIAI